MGLTGTPAAFARGFQSGDEAARSRRAHKEMLADEAHALKVNDVQQRLAGLTQKLSSLGSDHPEYEPTKRALEETFAARNDLLDPVKHPGALVKFGHFLTDATHITNPDMRTLAANRKDIARHENSVKQAEQAIAAGPLSPEQQAEIDARVKALQQDYSFQEAQRLAKQLGMLPEPEREVAARLMGLPQQTAHKPLTGSKPYKGADGKYYQSMMTPEGAIVAEPMPADYVPTQTALPKKIGNKVPVASGTGAADIWTTNPYNLSDMSAWVWMPAEPSRTGRDVTSTAEQTDPYGVVSKSVRTTGPAQHRYFDLAGIRMAGADFAPPTPEESAASGQATASGQAAATGQSAVVTPPAATPAAPRRAGTAATPKELKAKVPNTPASVTALHHPDGPGTYGAPRVTDNDGHVPIGASDEHGKAINEGLREAANQLLDGMDIKEIQLPSRDKEFAAGLARMYGWGRGPYTPRELKQMQNARMFLDKVENSKGFMRLLDSGIWARTKASVAEKDPTRLGLTGTAVHQLAVSTGSPEQQEYVRLRQAMMGTISGLSAVVRSGRATEATINRLAQEIPDVMAAANSKDARERIKNIKAELDLAMRQGVPPPTTKSGGTLEEKKQQVQKALNGGGESDAMARGSKIRIGDKTYSYNGTGDTGDLKNYTEVKQ